MYSFPATNVVPLTFNTGVGTVAAANAAPTVNTVNVKTKTNADISFLLIILPPKFFQFILTLISNQQL